MRNILTGVAVLLSVATFSVSAEDGLNPISGLEEEEKIYLNAIAKDLNVDFNNSFGYDYFEKVIEPFSRSSDTFYITPSHEALEYEPIDTTNKNGRSSSFVISIDDRAVIVNNVYFEDEGVIKVSRREIVPVSTRNALGKVEIFKEDEELELLVETGSFVSFNKTGYLSNNLVHIFHGGGVVIYDSTLFVEK